MNWEDNFREKNSEKNTFPQCFILKFKYSRLPLNLMKLTFLKFYYLLTEKWWRVFNYHKHQCTYWCWKTENISFKSGTSYLIKLEKFYWCSADVQSALDEHSNSKILNGYTPFRVIVKYYLLSLFYTMYPCSLFILYAVVCTSQSPFLSLSSW